DLGSTFRHRRLLGASTQRNDSAQHQHSRCSMHRHGLPPHRFAREDQWIWTMRQPSTVWRSTIVSVLNMVTGLPSLLVCSSLSLPTHASSLATLAVRCFNCTCAPFRNSASCVACPPRYSAFECSAPPLS